MRNSIIYHILILPLQLLSNPSSSQENKANHYPNILIITVDNVGYGDFRHFNECCLMKYVDAKTNS
jgi:hypothetical protein